MFQSFVLDPKTTIAGAVVALGIVGTAASTGPHSAYTWIAVGCTALGAFLKGAFAQDG